MNDRKPRSIRQVLFSRSGGYFLLCILSGILLTFFDLIIPQLLRIAVDSLLGSEPLSLPGKLTEAVEALGGVAFFRSHLYWVAVAVAVLGLLSALFRYFSNLFNAKAGETLVQSLRDALYEHIQRLPWRWHVEHPTGDIIQRCTSDVDRIKQFFQEQFVGVFRIVVLIVLTLGCMIATNARLSIVPLVLFPVIILYSLLFFSKIRERFTVCDENEGVLSTIVQENLSGVRVVRAFGRESYERERFDRQNEVYTGYWVKLCRTLSDFWAVGDIVSCIQVMLVVLFGVKLCIGGQMTAGEFISFAYYNAMIVVPVRRLGRMISEMSKAGVSLSRIREILSAEPERDAPDAEDAPFTGDIVFENVSFRYGEDAPVLENVSFTVPAGQSFGILGGTGSGKSSLLLLLCRLYAPTEGRITVGGADIAGMHARWVRRNIGAVLQEPFLFSRTIGENIGITGADMETVRAAAVTACIHGDIEKFERGYDTPVGERGVTLSGGQKQRVAIARTLTEKTPVIVFDDSLSAVDTETDERIRDALKRDLHCTTLIISHRITTLLDCDNVLVLDKGRVVQLGSPRELLARDGLFRRVYDMQMAIGEEEA